MVMLFRMRGEFLGTVMAPDKEAAEQAAVERFQLTAQQRERLVLIKMRKNAIERHDWPR
jgi:hypothetical protein